MNSLQIGAGKNVQFSAIRVSPGHSGQSFSSKISLR